MFFRGWLGYGTNVIARVLQEPTENAYIRRPFTLGDIDSGIVSDVGNGTVGPAVVSWGNIGFAGIFDAQIGGNLLLWMPLPLPLNISANTTITSGAGANRFIFSDLQVAGRNTHLWPADVIVARTSDGRALTAGVPLQVSNSQLSAQRQVFGTAVAMSALPTNQQAVGSGLLWNNGGVISVS